MSESRLPRNEKRSRAEEEVLLALKLYRDTGTARDFVPTRILYRVYEKWKRVIETGVPFLDHKRFGHALRHIFPNLRAHSDRRVMRTWGKKREIGFSHMLGPWSRKTKLQYDLHKTPTPAAPVYRHTSRYPEDLEDAAIMARGS